MIEAPLAHGGVAGAIAEAMVGLAVVAVLVAAWLRERSVRRRRDQADVMDETE